MRHFNNRQDKIFRILFFIVVLTISVFFISLFIGRYSISIKEYSTLLFRNFKRSDYVFNEKFFLILTRIRLPRIIACALVGASLSVSGCVFQALFKNPMASSNVLGVNQGAALGAVLVILNNYPHRYVVIISFFTGLLSVAVVYGLGTIFKMEKNVGLILSGMIVGSLFQAGVSLVKLIADPNNQLPSMIYWLTGSLSDITWTSIKIILLPVIVGQLLIYKIREPLNLLYLGSDKAYSLGVNTFLIKILAIMGATLLTASCVSISGMIGWIGLLIPHMSRIIIGNDQRYLIPCSAFLGSTFLIIVDSIGRSIYQIEIPIGILTALLGGPLFILLLNLGRGDDDFVKS